MSENKETKLITFAFIVDGEVAWLHSYGETIEQAIAAMRSNPTVVECPPEIVEKLMPNYLGWTYDNGVYNPPA